MRVSRIYCNTPLAVGLNIQLNRDTTHYIKNVLRLTKDDEIILFSGDGNQYRAKISHFQHQDMIVTIEEQYFKKVESPLFIHLGQAISKSERMDLTLQKSTELGVCAITPLFSARTEVKFDVNTEKAEKKMRHWQAIIVSACEQSGRNILPSLYPPLNCYDWMKNVKADTKVFLDPQAEHSFTSIDLSTSIALFTGPEGGMTDEERLYAQHQGFIGIKLGPRILRTETAGITAIACLQLLRGDLA